MSLLTAYLIAAPISAAFVVFVWWLDRPPLQDKNVTYHCSVEKTGKGVCKFKNDGNNSDAIRCLNLVLRIPPKPILVENIHICSKSMLQGEQTDQAFELKVWPFCSYTGKCQFIYYPDGEPEP